MLSINEIYDRRRIRRLILKHINSIISDDEVLNYVDGKKSNNFPILFMNSAKLILKFYYDNKEEFALREDFPRLCIEFSYEYLSKFMPPTLSPAVYAATIIYIISHILDTPIPMMKLAAKLHVTPNAIRNCKNTIKMYVREYCLRNPSDRICMFVKRW